MMQTMAISDKRMYQKATPHIMTPRKMRIMQALRDALEYCGYDMTELLGNKTHRRIYADLRAIIFSVYKTATQATELQLRYDLGWDRTTIWYSIRKAEELRKADINFADMYDSIEGAFHDALARIEEITNNS